MPASLPRNPNLDHLKKSAKRLLAVHHARESGCCPFLRTLPEFAKSSDADILAAPVALGDAQRVVARHYGFSSWARLRAHVLGRRVTSSPSLAAVIERSRHEIPEYCGAGVPCAVVAALDHAGVDIDFMEFAAASGWALSFGYRYDDLSVAYLAVRGNPDSDGPHEGLRELRGVVLLGGVSTADGPALLRRVAARLDRRSTG